MLGIRQEIRLDPKRIRHIYQENVETLNNTIFPSFTDKEYKKRLFNSNIFWRKRLGKNHDSEIMREFLLITYGMRKEKEFEKEARDHI